MKDSALWVVNQRTGYLVCRQGVGEVLRLMEPEAVLPPLPKDLLARMVSPKCS